MAVDPNIPSGPIPGENYTSDTKNYPWHRPPDFTSMDDAFEYLAEQTLDEDNAVLIITMLEMGSSVCTVVDMITTAAVGAGKFTVDYALNLVGPLSHVVCMMARRYGMEDIYLGTTEGKQKPKTMAFYRALQEIDKDSAGDAGTDIADALGFGGGNEGSPAPAEEAPSAPPSTGLGGMPPASPGSPTDAAPASPEGEQAAMLGQTDEGV